MEKVQIPIRGLASRDASPIELIGSMKTCTNWMCWHNMLRQPHGPTLAANAANAHSAIWMRDANDNGYIVYTDGRHVKRVDTGGNVSTITENEFGANAGNGRWPVTRFYKHIMFGSANDGMHWYYPESYTVNNNAVYTGKAGVDAPANAATPSAGNNAGGLTGLYKLVYTYVNALGHESGPSPASSNNIGFCSYDHPIVWANIEAGPTGTASRKLYRTVNDGELFLYLATLADNTTATYEDTILDTALGSEVEHDASDKPPEVIRGMCVAGSRLYLLDDDGKIWASKVDTNTSLPNWEAFPTALSSVIPAGESSDKVQNIFSLNEIVFAATRTRTFKLIGDPYTGQQVIKVAEVGMFNRYSWCYLIDADERYVCMLTSNFKVVKMDMEGNWVELGADLITAFQGITNYKAPDVGDSVDMLHDTNLNIITLHCATSGNDNHTTYVLDLNTGKWSGPIDWGYMFSLMDDTAQRYIGYEKGVRIVWHNNSSYQKYTGTYFNNQTFQTYPFFIPDRQLTIGRIGIVCRALPIVNSMPPMMKVEYAVDNNDRWTAKWVDVSNVPRRRGNRGNAQVTQELITVYIPVHATVASISVRVSAPQNAAALQGFEVYDMFVEAEEAEETPAVGKDIDKDER